MSDDATATRNTKMRPDDFNSRELLERIQILDRRAEQWPSWKNCGDGKEHVEATRAFRERWTVFMEGGWEDLLAKEPDAVSRAHGRAMQLIPAHPQAIRVADLLAVIVDIEKLAEEGHLFAALLRLERHGHAVFAAGWAYLPPPCVPRRGKCLEDMYLLFGYLVVREPPDDG